MRMRGILLALTLVPAALFSVAAHVPEDCSLLDDAGNEDTTDDVIACPATVYLSCKDAVNEKVYTPLDSVPLEAAAPTGSVTAGDGCGKGEVAQARGSATTSIYDINTTGFVEGNVDSLTVELHSIYAASARASGSVTLDVRAVVGGVSPVGFTSTPGTGPGANPIESPASFSVSVDPEPSATGASEALVFTITDVYEAFPELSAAGVGDGRFQTLDITVSVQNTAWAGTFVMGTTEVPASVTINGPARGTEVSAAFLKATSGT